MLDYSVINKISLNVLQSVVMYTWSHLWSSSLSHHSSGHCTLSPIPYTVLIECVSHFFPGVVM